MNSSSAPLISGFLPPFDPSGSGSGIWSGQGAFPPPPLPSLTASVLADQNQFPAPNSGSEFGNGAGLFPSYEDYGNLPWDGAGNDYAPFAGNLPPPPPFFFNPPEESPEMRVAIMWQNVAINFDYW